MGERRNRESGALMHISSLPGRWGTGDLGENAANFARILAEAGFSAWQMLPLAPTNGAFSHSPYSGESAFAGNIMYICPENLAGLGLVSASELEKFTVSGKADFDRALRAKREILKICHENFRRGEAYKTKFREMSDGFWDFCVSEAYWLDDYALFSVLKELEDRSWNEWSPEYRKRDRNALDALKRDDGISRALDERRFEQFLFFSQLEELRRLCRELNVALIGDLPIYVAYDSADVWGHQELFELDAEGNPASVAGVPPDYFSRTGQRWGNPIYRWDLMRNDGYQWWARRFRHALKQADMVRIDHFRGFIQYWSIPASEPTAEHGCWKQGPGGDLLGAMRREFSDGEGRMPFIAEDLGILTDDVIRAMEDFGLPGMKVLQFAFGEGMPDNPYIPHNHRRGCVVYTGTHDNNTAAGWWTEDATDMEKENFKRYTALADPSPEETADALIRAALSSTARLAVITVQDILRLGPEARMNTPSTTKGNWLWRLGDLDALKGEMKRIAALNELFGRSRPTRKSGAE
jgi:4-alpha-glucanotransferase